MSTNTVILDVREELRRGNDPFSIIMKTVDGLKPDQKLRLIAPFKPVPLLRVMADRGYTHDAKPLAGSNDWQVVFERDPQAAEGQMPALPANACGCNAVPVLEVDARGLEPPEPMVKILEAAASLPRGATLKARTDRRPIHLFAHLQHRELVGDSVEQPDGSYVTTIRHA